MDANRTVNTSPSPVDVVPELSSVASMSVSIKLQKALVEPLQTTLLISGAAVTAALSQAVIELLRRRLESKGESSSPQPEITVQATVTDKSEAAAYSLSGTSARPLDDLSIVWNDLTGEIGTTKPRASQKLFKPFALYVGASLLGVNLWNVLQKYAPGMAQWALPALIALVVTAVGVSLGKAETIDGGNAVK